MAHDDPAISWLLQSPDPSVRYLTCTEILGESPRSRRVRTLRAEIPNGERVRALLAGQTPARRVSQDSLATHPGGFGVHPYKKWNGAHWRLVSLVELAVPAGDARLRAAVEQVLAWLCSEEHRQSIKCLNGLTRRCASQEGNALAVCSRLGLAQDARVRRLAHSLVEWQWPDGGWNCDKRPDARHSSFYESLAPLWGLSEYVRVTQDDKCAEAAKRAAEFFFRHRLFRSDRDGRVLNPEWLKLHYPLYWHYDILQGLRVLSVGGKLGDSRAQEALDLVEQKRRPDGLWRAEGYYWRAPGAHGSNVEVVDWGRRGPNELITLNALRMLRAAGRL